MNVNEENSKDVLDINEVRVSAHKGEHPDDSEDYAAIGLSSEEEAEDLPDNQYIRRKFQIPPPLPSDPVPPVPPVPSCSHDPQGLWQLLNSSMVAGLVQNCCPVVDLA